MAKRYSLLIALCWALLLSSASQAQLLYGYQFQAQAGTYLPLGSGATRLAALEADEAITNAIPLGFTFVADGQFYTTIAASSNGWLGLSYSPLLYPSPGSNALGNGPPAGFTIAPLWSDLSGSGGTVSYQTTGTAPARVFTMEWRDFRWDRLASQAVVSFQARLYEGSNRIEFNYRPEAGSVSNNFPYSAAHVGLSHYYNNPSGATPIILSDLSAAPVVSNRLVDILAKPASGQQYSLVPVPNTVPPCVAPIGNLARLGRISARVQWVLGYSQQGTTARVHYGPAGFVLGTTADLIAPGVPGDSAQLTGLVRDTDYEFLLELDCGTGTPPGLSGRTRFRTYTPASNDEGSRAIWVAVLDVLRPGRLTEGSTRNASASLPANPGCAQPATLVYDVWYAFRATSPTHQIALTAANASPFVAEVRNGYGTNSQSIACGVSPGPLLLNNLTVGQAYFIRIYPLTTEATFQFGIVGSSPAVPANDQCAAAQPLVVAPAPGGGPPVAGTVRGATASGLGQFGNGACARPSALPSKDVFYRFVAPGATAEVQLRPNFRAGVEITNSCASGPFRNVDCAAVEAGKLGRLPLAGLTPGATYYLRVYNEWEDIILDDATFTIAVSAAPAPPANDECAGALPLPVTAPMVVGATGTELGATASGLAPPAAACFTVDSQPMPYAAPNRARDVWYQFTATTTTHALQLNATFDAVLEVLSSAGMPCASGAVVQRLGCTVARGQDAIFGAGAPPLPGRLFLQNLTAGSQYWVRVFSLVADGTASQPAGESAFTLSLNEWRPPANDEPANATPVLVSNAAEPCASRVEFTLDGATPTFPVAGGGPWAQRDVWFSFVAPAAAVGSSYARVTLRLGENNQHMLAGSVELRDGIGPTASSLASTGIWNPSFSGARLNNPGLGSSTLVPGRTYYIRVYSLWPNPEPFIRITFCLSTLLNDEPCEAPLLPLNATGQCTQAVRGTTYGATTSSTNPGLRLPVPNCSFAVGPFCNDVWYRIVPTSTAFTLRCDDLTVGLARLYLPFSATSSCSGAMQLMSCQTSQAASNEVLALGTVLFDNLTVGQTYYLALSNSGALTLPGAFTLCAQAATALPVRPGTGPARLSVWPNPVAVGEPLNVGLPVGLPANAAVRVEWLSAIGQVLPALEPGPQPAANGVLRVGTAGRPAGLYLLRLWLPNGQPLPVHRVVLE